MSFHKSVVAVLLAAPFALFGIGAHAASSHASKTPKPAITLKQARATALKAYPGKVVNEELEHERGGSGLRYSFDLERNGKWREVGVDAMTGRILENTPESPNPKD